MTSERKQLICKLLKGIETGDPESVDVINPNKYIQHNPQTHEGREGLAALFKRLSKTNPEVNIVRIFSDGDFIFGHTEYNFSTPNAGFEVFRFEGKQTVEHWDNIQKRQGPNSSGHSMVDGTVDLSDLELTEVNRRLIESFICNVLVPGNFNELSAYVLDAYVEHSPMGSDGITSLKELLSTKSQSDCYSIQYKKIHRLLAEGNFVLSACEGIKDQCATSFYDLYRIENGKIAEHWDTTETIPPESEWQNDNGKF